MTAEQFHKEVSELGFHVLSWEEDLFRKFLGCKVMLRTPPICIQGPTWKDLFTILSRPVAIQVGILMPEPDIVYNSRDESCP